MDGSILQIGLLALIGAMILTMHEMGAALRPVTCPECAHCQARLEADRRTQEELAREYARKMNLPEDDDRSDRI